MRSIHRTLCTAALLVVASACGDDGNGGGGNGNEDPVAAFTVNCNALACTFTDTSTDPDGDDTIESWSWDFGGDGDSDEQNPVHDHPKRGTDGCLRLPLQRRRVHLHRSEQRHRRPDRELRLGLR
jgi:hypothetical protein